MEVAVAVGFPPIQLFYVAIRPHRQQGRIIINGVNKPVAASKVFPFNIVVLKKIDITFLI